MALKHHLRERLRERGATLLLATHALEIVEHYADHTAMLIEGRITREWLPAEIAELRRAGRAFDGV